MSIKSIVSVIENKCRQCYTCVRNCPVNAVQIRNGQASIIYSRCINCGKCVKGCPQKAMVVIDNKTKAEFLLNENGLKIACLSSSFIVGFIPYSYTKVAGALKKLGFNEVWDDSIGAAELAAQTGEFINKNNDETYASTRCPAFVSMIEKHYPELIGSMLPLVSPMIASGRIIREKHKGVEVKIIYIGPCIAQKAEASDPQYEGTIDCVITFDELKDIFYEKGINLNLVDESSFDCEASGSGSLFNLPAGLLRNLDISSIIDETRYYSANSDTECLSLVNDMLKKKLSARIVDASICKGCIEGPKIISDLSFYEKIETLYKYFNLSKNSSSNNYNKIDLSRSFKNRRRVLAFPSEEEIQKVLNETNKYKTEDELNCGACGYNTCREKAIAVIQGIAEVDMCLPYLLSKKTKLYEELEQRFNYIKLLKDELSTILESSYDGLAIMDIKGRVIMANKSWSKMAGYDLKSDDGSIGSKEDRNFIIPSSILMALKEKRRVSFIHKSSDGDRFLETCTPVFDENGAIERAVINVRDIDSLDKLMQQLEETMKLEKYHASDSQKGKLDFDSGNIIANSIEFGRVLQTASSVAPVESTILILGESGVGKDIIAKLIHKLSRRNDKPLIKINCGAIPENLIESELFGYETGAFTGAKTKGKPGLIELAHEGTLFLDEIGELPVNLQVKLLSVIQDKKLLRLGGTVEKEIDVRIIAATNRDLYSMVKEGKFRADLYYRLNVVPIDIPPLRGRRADIIPLCCHFIDKFNRKYGCSKELSAGAEKVMYRYNWPGNVRELENVIERLVVTSGSDLIDERDLPVFLLQDGGSLCDRIKIDGIMPLKEACEILEKELIERAYKKYGTTYEMADALGVNQSTIVRKIQKYLKVNALEH